jgi:serine/threonine-protein kinase
MAGETILNGRYLLVAQQGSGGMSVIYKAVDRALGRNVAIKILRPSLTRDPSFLEKFRNEARAVANLSHPNVVTVYDVGSDGPTHYIVMELIEGQDLKKIIKSQGALPVDRALKLAVQMCAGIGYAHRSGLVHADVKPQNILVTSTDIIKVTDFGIAQALSDTQPQQRAEVVWGSPHYFAPEQARGEQPTPMSDVYAIGIVMFEMLTGKLPYAGVNQQDLALAHIREPIPNLSNLNPAIPDRISKMVYRAMSKDPRDRFRDADQLGNVLTDYHARAQDYTAVQPGIASSPSPTVPSPSYNAPADRPEPINTEVTAKYSAAPNAPQPYDPRQSFQQAPSVPAAAPQRPAAQPPQPFEQRYTPAQQQPAAYPPYQQPPAYQNPPVGDSAMYQAHYSQPIAVEEEEGLDIVTIALAILAVIAVGGLLVLWIFVLTSL